MKIKKIEIDFHHNLKLSAPSTTRGHQYKLEKTRAKSRFGQNRFSRRVTNNWNSLSAETVLADTVNQFKSRLNQDWKNRDNKFDV